jgi:putative ABC transport system ATP-binding protein
MTKQVLVTATNVNRTFLIGSEEVHAVRNVSIEIESGKLLAITGRSGSGKTTLLNLLAGLDIPTSGTVMFEGQDLAKRSEAELTELRRHRIGFVFQSFGLLPLLSAYENVELPLRIARWDRAERHRRTERCIEQVGLGARAKHRPYELSGGEVQRLAIARALVHQPSLILADEPTGELDLATGQGIFKLLKDISSLENVGIVVATHDMAMASIADEVKNISDGSFSF